ncbi:hypothetical protein F4819DRAFT_474827 [Hypoxylon fuscum]|nr:hypothetical protein F4819DRAFT_474827 [Hypoxylon fuscum]
MQLVTIISAATLVASALGKCLDTGLRFGRGDLAMSTTKIACQLRLSGEYNGHDTREACIFFDEINQGVYVSVTRIQDNKQSIAEPECYDGLHKEVKNCSHGGHSSYDNWAYT